MVSAKHTIVKSEDYFQLFPSTLFAGRSALETGQISHNLPVISVDINALFCQQVDTGQHTLLVFTAGTGGHQHRVLICQNKGVSELSLRPREWSLSQTNILSKKRMTPTRMEIHVSTLVQQIRQHFRICHVCCVQDCCPSCRQHFIDRYSCNVATLLRKTVIHVQPRKLATPKGDGELYVQVHTCFYALLYRFEVTPRCGISELFQYCQLSRCVFLEIVVFLQR